MEIKQIKAALVQDIRWYEEEEHGWYYTLLNIDMLLCTMLCYAMKSSCHLCEYCNTVLL